MPSDPQREAALFQAAAQLTGGARAAFLDQACQADAALRTRLEALLSAHDQSEGLLADAPPATDIKGTLKVEIPQTPPEDEAIGQRIGRYKILEKVGEGGWGVVYVAEQTEPVRRRVALKVIKLGMDTKAVVARFEAERQALAMMDHPNIAKVLDAGSTGSSDSQPLVAPKSDEGGSTPNSQLPTGRPYFVMELVRGIRITDYCDQNNLSTKERLDLFIKICQAIQHAHQKGIIHRDIKPSNILVTLHDGVPIPKVIDFGIAKATEGRLTDATVYTQLHQFIGTPAYMSPEQAEMSGLDIDTRSDIYSLGVLLYELLTGKTPFDANELMSKGIDAMRKTIREQEPARPSTKVATLQGADLTTTAKRRSTDNAKLLHQLKGDLDWIAMKCLEKDRTRRYETANGLAADLKRHLDNEPVVARPPSAAYKLQKAFRRNKLVFAGAALIIGVLAVGVVVSSWQAVRARRAQRTASEQRGLAEKEAKRAGEEATRAEEARKIADRETIRARRSAAQADARYLLQQRLLPAALSRATEAFKLGGEWEDGLLIHDIAAAARQSWLFAARVPMDQQVTVACLAKPQGNLLVLSVAGGLRVVDTRSAATVGAAPFERDVRYLLQGQDSNTVVAVSESAISVLSLPLLTVTARKALPSPPTCATTKGNSVLLVLQNHDVCLFDLSSLSDKGAFNWDKNPVSKALALPRRACMSPDGKLVILHGGSWNLPSLIWDRRTDPPSFSTDQIRLQQLQFVDNAHVASWYQASSTIDGWIGFYDVEHGVVRKLAQTVPNDDTKGNLELQTWSSREWGFDQSFPILGLVGPGGVVLKGLSGGELGGFGKEFTVSDRYANLLPTEADAPEFLAADLASGVLALRCPKELLIFRVGGSSWNSRAIEDYCATACLAGLLAVSHEFTPTSVRVSFTPFDPRQAAMRFSLQWPADSHWLPWGIAATPDASTVALVAQESDSGDSHITARYGRIRALIYHPGDLKAAPSAWPIQSAFELDAPTANAWSSRFLTLDPAARTLLYWNSATTVTRYDTGTGKSLGTVELAQVAARSRDGSRVAGISPSGRLRVYDTSSGDTLLDLASTSASALCFSADGSRLIASVTNRLCTYDIASRREISSVASGLLPLAYPSRGNRFLAFQPDGAGSGGSVVLADTANAHVAAVLSRAGNSFTPAFFSDSGDQFALVRDRWTAEVIRSLRPDELSSVLTTSPTRAADMQSLPPTNIVTARPVSAASLPVLSAADIAGLESRLGDHITVHGLVRDVALVNARNAANIRFANVGDRDFVVWVPWTTYPKLVAVLGEDLRAALKDHTISATGQLTKFRETLEVTLDDPSKLEVLKLDSSH